MEFFDTLNDFIRTLREPAFYLICAVFSVVLYVVFQKKDELGRNAIQNTAATFIVHVMNMVASLFFHAEINGIAQRTYQSLNIPTLPANFWSGSAVWIGFLLVILGRDFCDYFLHRTMHTRWGWPAHAAHHTDTHVNGFTTFRVHFLETTAMQITYLFLLTWMQLPQLIPILALLRLIHNFYVHLDLDWTHGRFKYLIASPAFHRWHHADVPEAQGKNLATMVPLFDVVFGTYYDPGPCRAPMGARASGLSDKNPILIWIYPFQQWVRLLRGVAKKIARRLDARRTASQLALPPGE
ncbi:sterol desaturase family protein [Tabrizicola sp.]|uniref:sterol desaturase family protein n=1 Tax=Tabrizicola sp. TaxID=2005166 RepID=UPI0035B4AE0D